VAKNTKTIRQQLAKTIKQQRPKVIPMLPNKGWIAALRSALGMSQRQLGERVGMKQQMIDRIEKAEPTGNVTIKQLRNVAEGLGCVFVYGIFPEESLEKLVEDRAREKSLKLLNEVGHSMLLEDQDVSEKEKNEILQDMIDKVMNESSRKLWD
jgi:predicted DNA-binding mobile mystery protein A